MPSALIVDDEPLARAHLIGLLQPTEVRVVGEAATAEQAILLTEDLSPDIVFLDIKMPGLSGLQVAEALVQLPRAPLLIFVTGYTEHAVAAFEHNALDYLLKPIAYDRLAVAIERAVRRLTNRDMRVETESSIRRGAIEGAPITRLPVRRDYTVQLLRVETILCATARDKRVYIRTPNEEHRTYYTLTQLESLLPTDTFFRLHDSVIVNLSHVCEVASLGDHQYSVRLTGGIDLPVSRHRYGELKRRLGLAPSRIL